MRLLRVAGFALLALAGSAPAAESLTYLDTAGRYADLKSEVEARLARGEKPTSTLMGNLCIAHARLKAYDKLFVCLDRLEQNIRSGDTRLELDQSVMFISDSDVRPLPDLLRARAYFELGEYGKAIDASRHELEVLTRIPELGGTSLYPTARLRIEALEVQAMAAIRLGDTALADDAEKRLRDVSYGFIGGRMWGWMKSNALGQVNMAMGRYKEALAVIPDTSGPMKAVVSIVNSLGPYAYRGDSTTTLIEMPRRVMRGKALAETGAADDAKAVFDELLASARLKDMGDLYWVVLFERGRLAEADKQYDEAVGRYREAVEIVEQQRSSIATEGSKIGFVGDKQELYSRLIALLLRQGHADEGFDYVERSKSRALVDMLASKKDFASKRPQQARAILSRLESADLSAPMEAANATSTVRNLQLARREAAQEEPELASLVTVTSVAPAELQKLVGAGTALVEYYYRGKDMYAFILDGKTLRAVQLDASGLDEEVQAFRKAIETPSSQDWRTLSRSLYARLWAPVGKLLSAQEIIVVAHGALHYVPFAALEDDQGRALVETYGLRFLPSASTLKYLRPPSAEPAQAMLVLGNPDLGDPRLDLPFAEGEARMVAGMSPSGKLLLRSQASESNFRAAGSGFSRLHFATHGKFEAEHPLASGLYLAKDAANDGVLTVDELYSISLNADLVTLSACETGLGKLANGDDVVGLTRGFLYAGSRSIVASLWSVDDRATSELMKAFYENLGALDKARALQQAQLKTRGSFAHPFFWAAFQLTGSGT